MTSSPRILTIMGSGETSPTMVKTHRESIARLQKKRVCAVILDTPFGFQENADDISAKAKDYFKISVNIDAEVASLRSKDIDLLALERFYSTLERAEFVFAGPGSPTYALDHWSGTRFRTIMETKLLTGPCVVTFSSAAALTLGSRTVPVYEIYKVGHPPAWKNGLDLLGAIGIKGAVIPHFNNAEGGNHDTRFCYLGHERLTLMESQLDTDESVFGIDEHTAIIIDLDSGKATVAGNGTFNIRNMGRQATFQSGDEIPLGSLQKVDLLFGARAQSRRRSNSGQPARRDAVAKDESTRGVSPLLGAIDELRTSFDKALESRDADSAVKAALSLQTEIDLWQNETFQSNEMEQAKSALRTMIVRLGELAAKGVLEPEEVYGPFVELALQLRAKARDEKRYDDSDQIRDQLATLGIQVRDNPQGSEWISIGSE